MYVECVFSALKNTVILYIAIAQSAIITANLFSLQAVLQDEEACSPSLGDN